MKNKIILLTSICCFLFTAVVAQHDNNRTITTKIADLLAQLPAENAKKLQQGMEEIGSWGKPGILQLAGMLSATGDNSKIEFALSGFTYYVSQNGKENLRKLAVEAYLEALIKQNQKEKQQFLIYQLQTIGKDESVSILKTFLSDEYLCGPASRALAKIGTMLSSNALLDALKVSSGNNQLPLAEALGNSEFKPAATTIESMVASAKPKLKNVLLFALSNIGSESSEKIVSNEAQKTAYVYEVTNATGAYVNYLHMLGKSSPAKAELAIKQLLANTTEIKQIPTKTAALKLLVDIQKEKSLPTLIEAMNNSDVKYRAAALKFAQIYSSDSQTPSWLAILKNASPQVQTEIITMLGETKAISALPTMLSALKSKDQKIKLAAIKSAVQVGQDQALQPLLAVLKRGDSVTIKAIKNVLLVMKGNNVVNQLAAAKNMSASAQSVIIEVLAARAASDKINIVFNALKSKDQRLKESAYSSLKFLATETDLPQLFTLLNTTTEENETKEVQFAIINALKKSGDVNTRTTEVLSRMDKNTAHDLPLLAGIGGQKALDAVTKSYRMGDSNLQKIAVEALSKWTDAGALDSLYQIGKGTNNPDYLDQSLKGYVRAINMTNHTPVQKVLLLRKGMEIAKTPVQKDVFINELQRHKTFNALFFAGKYLNDSQLQQAAAETVMIIALANKDFKGNDVRKLLLKTIEVMNGKDSEYKKQSIRKYLAEMPEEEGFVALFNGKDLSGWKGLVADPIKRAKMDASTLAAAQIKADEKMREGWTALNENLVFNGHGENLCTIKQYRDFEMYVDWKIEKNGDAGIYLRGSPQVQIWDTSRTDVGAQVGSGGLYNNRKNEKNPLTVADNAIGDWNTLHIIMKGDRVSVELNGQLVVSNVILENYWDRSLPIFVKEQIELQAHGTMVAYRDIYLREIASPEPYVLNANDTKAGFKLLFDGTNTHEWIANPAYTIDEGNLLYNPKLGQSNLMTKQEYGDFIFRFQFQLTQGANNGLGIRAPLEGDAAYEGMEIQILDDNADIYKALENYQYHGSVYGVIPAKRGYLKPMGEWNEEEIKIIGSKIKVTLNGHVITEGDILQASKDGTLDKRNHPGLKRASGHIGFLGHGSVVRFKNISIKDLSVEKNK